MSSDLKLNLLLKATDSLSGIVKSACTQSIDEFEKMNKALAGTADKFDAVGKKAAIFGGALVGLSAANAKMAGDFEAGMNNISTLIDTNSESLDLMGKEVLKIGKNSPKAISDLTDGLYSIRSAGIEAQKQFDVLSGSEKLAVAGLATTAEAVDIATSAINAFNLKGKEADGIYDMFFKVVKYGKTNVSEFAQGFGSVAGVVAASGIKLDEYSASVAAMTTSGLKANIAHTQLKAAIAGLSRGSKEQMIVFSKLGATSFEGLVAKSGGMVNAFSEITKATNGNKSELIQLLGSVEAYNAVLSLTGANNKTYLQALNDMRYSGDALTEAYNKQASGLNNQTSALRNNIQALSISFGTALLPVIKATTGVVNGVVNAFDKMPDGLKSFISVSTAGIGVISLFAGTSLMAIGSITRGLIGLRIATQAINIAMWANPAIAPIAGIVAGIAALSAGAIYCYNHFEPFKNTVDTTVAVFKALGANLALSWRWITTTAKAVYNANKPVIDFALNIATWLNPLGAVIKSVRMLWGWLDKLVQKTSGKSIGDNIKDWAVNQEQLASEKNAELAGKVDGSHANGLSYVPFDGYRAKVHEGEAILTKDEATIWRNRYYNNESSETALKIDFHPQITMSGGGKTAKEEFLSCLYKYKDELVQIVLDLLKNREARAY